MKKILALALMALLMMMSGSAMAIEMGDHGDEVLELQQLLHDEGFLDDEPDGSFGWNTYDAVELAQLVFGMDPTGVADEALMERLREEQDNFFGENPEEKTRAMQKGDSGDDVLSLQMILVEQGFLSDTPDGKFGGHTEQAVKDAQAAFGLPVTGVADESLLSRLNGDTGGVNLTDYVVESDENGRMTRIDLTDEEGTKTSGVSVSYDNAGNAVFCNDNGTVVAENLTIDNMEAFGRFLAGQNWEGVSYNTRVEEDILSRIWDKLEQAEITRDKAGRLIRVDFENGGSCVLEYDQDQTVVTWQGEEAMDWITDEDVGSYQRIYDALGQQSGYIMYDENGNPIEEEIWETDPCEHTLHELEVDFIFDENAATEVEDSANGSLIYKNVRIYQEELQEYIENASVEVVFGEDGTISSVVAYTGSNGTGTPIWHADFEWAENGRPVSRTLTYDESLFTKSSTTFYDEGGNALIKRNELLSGARQTILFNRLGYQTAWYTENSDGSLSQYCAMEIDEMDGSRIRTVRWNSAGDYYVETSDGQGLWYLADGTLYSTDGSISFYVYADGTREKMIEGVSYTSHDGDAIELWLLDGPGRGYLWVRNSFDVTNRCETITEYDRNGNIIQVQEEHY